MMYLLLMGCSGDKADSAAPVAEAADPWVVIAAATAPDYLKSSCTVAVDLYASGSETSSAHAEVGARGGEWAGVAVAPEVLSTAQGAWAECLNNDLGTGELRSGTFSAAMGDLFVFRYVGTSAAFLTLKQGEDHEGGVVHVSFTTDTTQADVEALATTWEASVSASDMFAGGYELRWLKPTSVGEVLASLSADERYVQGAPGWVNAPDGW
jgi:hypothetical protein